MDPVDVGQEPNPGFLDSLFASTEIESNTFDVEFPGGHKMTFEAITDWNRLKALKAKAATFLEATRKKSLWPEKYRECYIKDPEMLAQCSTFAETIVAPKLGAFEFAKIAFKRPFVFEYLKSEYNRLHEAKAAVDDDEELEQAKKD